MIELGPRARKGFVVAYLAAQLGLILTADRRPDRVFGFRMFNESSSLKFDLYRVVRGRSQRTVPIRGGEWRARTAGGERRVFRWTDRVRYRSLMTPGVSSHASYGVEAQLFRLQAALNDLAAHLPQDRETVAWIAIAEPVKNGHKQETVRLSAWRRR